MRLKDLFGTEEQIVAALGKSIEDYREKPSRELPYNMAWKYEKAVGFGTLTVTRRGYSKHFCEPRRKDAVSAAKAWLKTK